MEKNEELTCWFLVFFLLAVIVKVLNMLSPNMEKKEELTCWFLVLFALPTCRNC